MSEFKSRQTVLRFGNKPDILISKSGLHERERDDIWLSKLLVFQHKWEITIGLAALCGFQSVTLVAARWEVSSREN
jgi:hypothetical protein